MRQYLSTITLVKNKRGVWDLDTSKGCSIGIAHNPQGCYGDCYAARNARRYGIDFGKTVLRYFKNKKHEQSIIDKINKIDMPFVRIGVTGDPSENWEHTLNVCEKISSCNWVLYKTYMKVIVIITKHWNNLTEHQLGRLSNMDICINTSISALDEAYLVNNRLAQYNKLKKYCKSVLRIVSCNFNLQNEMGVKLNLIQKELFKNEYVLDTILRVSNKNEYVLNGIINIERVNFLGRSCYVSRYNKNTYFGGCIKCPEKCGVNLTNQTTIS